jgi:hypothetical protein
MCDTIKILRSIFSGTVESENETDLNRLYEQTNVTTSTQVKLLNASRYFFIGLIV